jgi:hypothetical protein
MNNKTALIRREVNMNGILLYLEKMLDDARKEKMWGSFVINIKDGEVTVIENNQSIKIKE